MLLILQDNATVLLVQVQHQLPLVQRNYGLKFLIQSWLKNFGL